MHLTARTKCSSSLEATLCQTPLRKFNPMKQLKEREQQFYTISTRDRMGMNIIQLILFHQLFPASKSRQGQYKNQTTEQYFVKAQTQKSSAKY